MPRVKITAADGRGNTLRKSGAGFLLCSPGSRSQKMQTCTKPCAHFSTGTLVIYENQKKNQTNLTEEKWTFSNSAICADIWKTRDIN